MDESTVQAQVAKNIPVEPTVEPLQTKTPTQDTPPKPSVFESNIEINDPAIGLQLSDYFSLDRVSRWDESSQRQMREIYNWASERAQSNELPNVFNQLRLLEAELGIAMKPNKLQTMARFVELKRQSDAINTHMEMIKNG